MKFTIQRFNDSTIQRLLVVLFILLIGGASVPASRAQDAWPTNWSWTAPDWPAGQAPYWYDYGWGSSSNGPAPAELAQAQLRRAAPAPLPPTPPFPDSTIQRFNDSTNTRLTSRDHTANPFRSGDFAISPYASLRVHEFDGQLERIGTGLAASYHLRRTVALEAETLTENRNHNFIDEAGLNLKAYLPIAKTGFAPYGLVGTTKEFERHWDWRLNAGAGLEFRAAKTFGVFVDGRWTHNFRDIGHALFRTGLNLRF